MENTPLFDDLKWRDCAGYYWQGRRKYGSLEAVVTGGPFTTGPQRSYPSKFLDNYEDYETYNLSVFLDNGIHAHRLIFEVKIDVDDSPLERAMKDFKACSHLTRRQVERALTKVKEIGSNNSSHEVWRMMVNEEF